MSAELQIAPSGAATSDDGEARMVALRNAAGVLDKLFDLVGPGPVREHVRAARGKLTNAIVAAHNEMGRTR